MYPWIIKIHLWPPTPDVVTSIERKACLINVNNALELFDGDDNYACCWMDMANPRSTKSRSQLSNHMDRFL